MQPEEATNLTEEQRHTFIEKLRQYLDRFHEDVPPTTEAEHAIETVNETPIATPPYRLNASRQVILREQLDKMLSKGIIEESTTPWTTPVVLVPKAGNEKDLRVCIDYRRLNAITTPDRYPLPRIDDLLHSARGLPSMSSLDLQSGYWQIPVREKDKRKTGFITPFGLYHFNRIPFGLRNAPMTFQCMMDRFRVTLDHVAVSIYLDDLIVRSPTFETH